MLKGPLNTIKTLKRAVRQMPPVRSQFGAGKGIRTPDLRDGNATL